MTSAATEWREFALGELLNFSNGINAEKSAYGAGVLFANVLEVITNESIAEADIPGRITIDPKMQRRYEVKQGDVLFNRTSETQEEVGLASLYVGNEPIVFGGFVFRGRPLTDELLTPYSKYAFRSPFVRNQIVARGQGGIRANIGQRDLKSIAVCLPSRREQSAIANALDDVSNLVVALERLISKKQAIKQGMMQELLTGRTRLHGFTDEWQETRLGEVLKFQAGYPFPSHGFTDDPSGVRLIRNRDLRSSNATIYVRGNIPSDYVVTSGDVLVGMDGDFEPVIWSDGSAALNQRVGRLRFTSRAHPAYIAYALVTSLKELEHGTGATTVKHLSHSDVENLVMVLPSYSEQAEIARALVAADRELDVLTLRAAKACAIKQGMMQQLLTGRVRFPVEAMS